MTRKWSLAFSLTYGGVHRRWRDWQLRYFSKAAKIQSKIQFENTSFLFSKLYNFAKKSSTRKKFTFLTSIDVKCQKIYKLAILSMVLAAHMAFWPPTWRPANYVRRDFQLLMMPVQTFWNSIQAIMNAYLFLQIHFMFHYSILKFSM